MEKSPGSSQSKMTSRAESNLSQASPQETNSDFDLDYDLEDLSDQLECYLSGVMRQLDSELKEIPESQPLLILADSHLLDLPIEILPQFKTRPISRDFSIQIHQERLHQLAEVAGKGVKDGKAKGGSEKGGNSVQISRFLGLGSPGKCLNMLNEQKLGCNIKSGLSTGELEKVILESNGLLYCGRERFMASLSPHRVAALD